MFVDRCHCQKRRELHHSPYRYVLLEYLNIKSKFINLELNNSNLKIIFKTEFHNRTVF